MLPGYFVHGSDHSPFVLEQIKKVNAGCCGDSLHIAGFQPAASPWLLIFTLGNYRIVGQMSRPN